ncbi:transporter permease [Adhaeribacter arboris]|uniref:Transporter permease n=1 Tax=Adhaeribacter arboris TaxID=2072846 RepID=A0A2T2YKC1_9BACT|nr:ABC transporter permease [Adhaeribacter arboris]PSR55952.1 transporter permease [Adhaeribacter arboris]
MFRTNLKIAWRNLVKDKQFTFINVLGLSAGLACSLLIFLWVKDELSYDKFFANEDRIYKLMENNSEESSGLLSDAVKQQIPGVKYAAAVAPSNWFPQYTLSVGDKNIKANGQYTGKDYFHIFSFKLIEGKKNGVLENKNSIVLSDELAKKLFGSTENIIGKPVRFDQATTFYVSGVFEKVPKHSSQQFDFVLSFEYFKIIKDWVTRWENKGPHNYILLDQKTDIKAFNKKVSNIIAVNFGDTTSKVSAARFSDLYLHNNYGNNAKSAGRIEYVRLFSILAIFILVIACINFMNLSTAKASGRLKEIGIKKVIGADRKQLIFQFLSESLLLTLLATVLAAAIAILLLPAFNQITGKQIILNFDTTIIVYLIVIILGTGLLAGSYPALYLSKFNPLSVLKGKLHTSAAEVLSRKGLVVFQFTLSTILIVAVMVIYQQIQLIQNTDAGYNKNNILRLSVEGNIRGKEKEFIAELKNIPGVVNASSTLHKMIGHGYSHYGMNWPGKDPSSELIFEAFEVDYDFIETMGMQIKEGRSFSRSFGADSTKIVLNETAAKMMGLKDPVGKNILKFGNKMQIIGVVKDFHFESLHEPIKPCYLSLLPGNTIVARVQVNNERQTIAAIGRLYENYNPGLPFTFNFLEEAYQKQYESETRVSALSKYFAGLAIVISCLGLFGLAAFTAQKRRKEIAVRKVIGASVINITTMLSKDFLKLIFISLTLALPAAGWLMSNWLQSYAYRIRITPYIFVITGLSIILITLFTISFQAIKAAMANPVKSLKTE